MITICLLLISVNFFFCNMKSVTNFEISSDSDFYIVAENSITGYRLDNVNPIKTVGSEVEVVKGNQNPVVERAELQNRYLVFTDDDWPLSRNEGIISIDFQKGTILFYKTRYNAYTAAGATAEYYFASTSSGESTLSVYTSDLKETGRVNMQPFMILSNFRADRIPFYLSGTDIEASENEIQSPFFKNRLLRGDIQNSKLSLEVIGELETNPYCQYWFLDTIYKNEMMYAISPGYRVHESHEKVIQSALYKYNPKTGEGSFVSLEIPQLTQIYDLNEEWMVFTTSPGGTDTLTLTFSILFQMRIMSCIFQNSLQMKIAI